ncbi:glycosyltransferase family 4 protein [Myxococcota bacterium]|nr:glycosyltransferase family 4 protein [Myxococcota bacterium]
MTRARTIALVGPGPSVIGGVARSVARHAEQLGALGHRVAIVEPTVELFPGDVVCRDGVVRLGVVDVGAPELHEDSLARVLRGVEPDVVLGYYGTTHGAGAIGAATRLGVPAALMLRGNDVDVDAEDPVRGERLRRAIHGSARVTVVSREMAVKVRARTGRDAVVLRGAVDTSRFRPDREAGVGWRRRFGLSAGDFVVGVFGELKSKRGIDRLVVATEGLAGLRVVLVGTIRPEVRGVVDAAGASGAVRWVHVPYLRDLDALNAAYNACDVVAQPSHADGRPNVVLEAMAAGRTVVATPIGGLVDVIDHDVTGLLAADDAAWREALRTLKGAPRPDLGDAARRVVPTLDEERAELDRLLAAL